MSCDKIRVAFDEINKSLELPEYLKDICESVSIGNNDFSIIDRIMTKNDINNSIAKVDFINIIFEYIKIALADNILTKDEKDNVHYLKKLFKIQPGDFYIHNKGQLEKIIACQLSLIYQDNHVTEKEALLKVDIQELFDLSFDQMNDYTKSEASLSIQRGADPLDLDVFFTEREYLKLKTF